MNRLQLAKEFDAPMDFVTFGGPGVEDAFVLEASADASDGFSGFSAGDIGRNMEVSAC